MADRTSFAPRVAAAMPASFLFFETVILTELFLFVFVNWRNRGSLLWRRQNYEIARASAKCCILSGMDRFANGRRGRLFERRGLRLAFAVPGGLTLFERIFRGVVGRLSHDTPCSFTRMPDL